MLRPTAPRESRGEENAVTFPTYRGEVPYLTTEQMVEVDRVMIEDFGVELIQMMENAGHGLAHLGRVRFFGGDPRGKQVTVLAGNGGNGGGAMACARRLQNWGARVRVLVTEADGASRRSRPSSSASSAGWGWRSNRPTPPSGIRTTI